MGANETRQRGSKEKNEMKLTAQREAELAAFAEFISYSNCPTGIVLPEVIANNAGITFSMGKYGDYFDGMLEHDSGQFHIYLNIEANDQNRIRFSFAHELAHYFIDEHRSALKNGKSLHKSYYHLLRKNVVETEADVFASNLLMPASRVLDFIKGRKFDFTLIESLAKEFQVSLSATLLRIIKLDIHPIMVVFSKDNKITNKWMSDDFPYKYFQDYHSGLVPALTVAGDFFNHDTICDDTEEVDANEWFSSYKDIRDAKVFEKCIYIKAQNKVISIIWPK
jgi:Zn-dependent peptidase ImmA (M78 family)